ncbi:MAG: tail protein X [Candidatus Pacebacteria bacterium]|nr:tail protein X [Candidatus Paceibacterota bacterium]
MNENRIYTTVQGDMWDSIAYEFYGDVKYIGLLLQNNPDLLDVFVFSAGTSVYIPELPEETEEDIPEWRL